MASLAGPSAAGVAAPQPLQIEVTPVVGEVVSGGLVELEGDRLVLEQAPGVRQPLPLREVRRIAVTPAPAVSGDTLVGLTDGSRLATESLAVVAATATAGLPGGPFEFPAAGLHWVAWSTEEAERPPRPPAWLGELPQQPDGDIVVIRRDEGWQFIACGIIEVSEGEVVVLLEDERIPVKRSKLAGLCWLRGNLSPDADPEPAAGEILLGLAGGSLRCRSISRAADTEGWRVELTAAAAAAILPEGSLASIDYAFGRQVDLTRRRPAAATVTPFFGGLAADEQLRRFFEPRPVAGAAGPGLLVRPRTEMIWTIPEGSRTFRATLQPGPVAAAATAVSVAVDGVERFRGEFGGTAAETPTSLPIEVDLTGGRQLRLLVDFARRLPADDPAAGMPLLGGPVLLVDPLIER